MSRCAHGVSPTNVRQERRRGRRAGVAAAAVLDVGDLALDLASCARPRAASARRARRSSRPRAAPRSISPSSLPNKPDAHLPSATTQAPVSVARSIDRVGLVLRLRVVQRVGEHDAALGVGVQHLDRLARRRGDDVARPVGGAARHVLGGADHADHVQGQLEQRARAQHADHGRGARHVVLHLVHARGGLDRDAAGVERDALADEADGRRAASAAPCRARPCSSTTSRGGCALPRPTARIAPILRRSSSGTSNTRTAVPPRAPRAARLAARAARATARSAARSRARARRSAIRRGSRRRGRAARGAQLGARSRQSVTAVTRPGRRRSSRGRCRSGSRRAPRLRRAPGRGRRPRCAAGAPRTPRARPCAPRACPTAVPAAARSASASSFASSPIPSSSTRRAAAESGIDERVSPALPVKSPVATAARARRRARDRARRARGQARARRCQLRHAAPRADRRRPRRVPGVHRDLHHFSFSAGSRLVELARAVS